MEDMEKKMNGIETISEDDMEAVAGGAGFKKCSFGSCYEAQFPEKICKHCPDFVGEKFEKEVSAKPYKYTCKVFEKTEWKNIDFWNIF